MATRRASGLWTVDRFEDVRNLQDAVKWGNAVNAELHDYFRALHAAGTHFEITIVEWAGLHPTRQHHKILAPRVVQPLHKGAEASALAARHVNVFSNRARRMSGNRARRAAQTPRVNWGR